MGVPSFVAAVAAGAICLATLTGCSSGGPLGEVGSVDELREAYVNAGSSCDEFREGPIGFGYCSGDSPRVTFVVYPSVESMEGYREFILSKPWDGIDYLFGSNWYIQGLGVNDEVDLERVGATLGGDYVPAATPTADSPADPEATSESTSSAE